LATARERRDFGQLLTVLKRLSVRPRLAMSVAIFRASSVFCQRPRSVARVTSERIGSRKRRREPRAAVPGYGASDPVGDVR
jgi:hypothetical protein